MSRAPRTEVPFQKEARMSTDTIAAISTAVSEAGIAIVRVSGPEAIAAVKGIFRPANRRTDLTSVPSHTIHFGWITEQGEILDEVLVSIMRAPRSYTAEDTAEINCHGGVFAVRRVLEAVLRQGVRPAEPGEFTKRAFLNGRIDLTRAEAVMDVISSGNELALKNSVKHLRGALFEKISGLRKSILYRTAQIEAALDDPEHYSLEGFSGELINDLSGWEEQLHRLICSFSGGRLISNISNAIG